MIRAVDLDQLVSPRGTTQDANGPAGKLERIGQQLHQRGVRRPSDRGRMHLHLERGAVPAHDARLCGTRLQMNLQPQGSRCGARAHRTDSARSRRLVTKKPCKK